MLTKLNIVGHYPIRGKQLIAQDYKLIILERKKTTPSKPKNYILAKLNTGETEYISSMYSTTQDGVFKIDYLGQEYTLTIEGSTAKFKSL